MSLDINGYQMPPEPINCLLDAPSTPLVSLSPAQDKLLFLHRPSLPPITEIAKKELRLAGLRINPKTNGASRSYHYTKLTLKKASGGGETTIENIPQKARIENVSWAPNGQHIAFTCTQETGLELWVADIQACLAWKMTEAVINDAISGLPYRWLSDSKTLVYKAVLENRPRIDEISAIPTGPTIRENSGKTSAVRTYQDLLKNKHDEQQFSYFTETQLWSASLEGKRKKLGEPGLVRSFSPSPNGNYLLITKIRRPFSYIVPYDRFPFSVEIWDREGDLVKMVAEIPVADDIPKGFGAVRKGPRAIAWRADVPATLIWVEALDKGNPKKKVAFRDQVYSFAAPFNAEPQKNIKTKLRYGGIEWGNADLAIITEWKWENRKIITSRFSPNSPEQVPQELYNRSWEDQYNDPGSFEMHRNKFGRFVLMTADNGQSLFLLGSGASPQGKFPFIDKLNLENFERQRLWQCEAPFFETPLRILDNESQRVLTRRESAEDVPNYFERNLITGAIKQFTAFPHPYETLKGIKKNIIRYKRRDGVELTGKLFLPLDYDKDKDGPLPVMMWAYPREYKSAEVAGQMTDSPHIFPELHPHSPLYLLTQGYAVLDGFSMPIVGEGAEEPNETFVEQIIMNAKAAIDTLVEMGVADRKRIAVGGHSYGAFMTANLLAHTNFFAAGIARSGAYNRTLTPFGFQSEERTYWEAQKTYIEMSPFSFADKIKSPLLMIHGEADDNSGTYPMQSERMYSALKGHGATVRLVMLPHESHGYQAEESVKHMLWEMVEWLRQYV